MQGYESVPLVSPIPRVAPSPSAPPLLADEKERAENQQQQSQHQPPPQPQPSQAGRGPPAVVATEAATVHPREVRGWQHGLCDCCDAAPETCIVSWCCSSCQTVKLHSFLLGEVPPMCCRMGVPLGICLGGAVAGALPYVGAVGGFVHSLHHWYVRRQLVVRLGIEQETECRTAVYALCCTSCSSVQVTHQLLSMGVPARLGMSSEDPRSLLDSHDEAANN